MFEVKPNMNSKEFYTYLMYVALKSKVTSGEIELPNEGELINVYCTLTDGDVDSPTFLCRDIFDVVHDGDISIKESFENMTTRNPQIRYPIHYQMTARFHMQMESTTVPDILTIPQISAVIDDIVIVKGKTIDDDEPKILFNRPIPYIEYGFGFDYAGIQRWYRPRRYLRPVTKEFTLPKERDSLLTMRVVGLHKEATSVSIMIIGEDGTTASTNISKAIMVENPEEVYVDTSTIYEFVKGASIQLIRYFYDVDANRTDEALLKHLNISGLEIMAFEREVARVTSNIWEHLIY